MHEVKIKTFAMGKYEVTFEEYDRFVIATGQRLPEDQSWGRESHPVINVSWEDAKAYAQWLSQQTGKQYRLPTESEWEYAARSGGKDEVWAGTSREEELMRYAVYIDNSGNRTAPVGEKEPNGIELYNMSGNVFEWVEDCVHENYENAPGHGSAWLQADKGDCDRRVARSYSWNNSSVYLRASARGWMLADNRYSFVGFRLAQDLEP